MGLIHLNVFGCFLFFLAMLVIITNEISLIFVFFRYIVNVFIFSGDYMETHHIKYLFVRLLLLKYGEIYYPDFKTGYAPDSEQNNNKVILDQPEYF